jgi:hypothetical protein
MTAQEGHKWKRDYDAARARGASMSAAIHQANNPEPPDNTVADVARTLCAIANDLRAAGDIGLVRLDPDGVAPAEITLADELWLCAFRLDQEVAMSRPENGGTA